MLTRWVVVDSCQTSFQARVPAERTTSRSLPRVPSPCHRQQCQRRLMSVHVHNCRRRDGDERKFEWQRVTDRRRRRRGPYESKTGTTPHSSCSLLSHRKRSENDDTCAAPPPPTFTYIVREKNRLHYAGKKNVDISEHENRTYRKIKTVILLSRDGIP